MQYFFAFSHLSEKFPHVLLDVHNFSRKVLRYISLSDFTRISISRRLRTRIPKMRIQTLRLIKIHAPRVKGIPYVKAIGRAHIWHIWGALSSHGVQR